MPSAETLLVFAALSLGLAVTPGPNMLYLVSRALAQGTRAGMVSLLGVQSGSLVIMLCAAAGITAAIFAVPYAWDALRLGGAAYLAWLAWQCVRPGGQPIFAPREMPRESDARLFAVGFATAALNPKVALFYVAVLPPFLDPAQGQRVRPGGDPRRDADRGLRRLRCGAGARRGGHGALPRHAAGLDGGATLSAGRCPGADCGEAGLPGPRGMSVLALFPAMLLAALLLTTALRRIFGQIEPALGLSMLATGAGLYWTTELTRWPVVGLVAASHAAAWAIIALRMRRFGR
jgi:threonine/homoserine/homoserine lactone efflux protein